MFVHPAHDLSVGEEGRDSFGGLELRPRDTITLHVAAGAERGTGAGEHDDTDVVARGELLQRAV